MADIFKEVDEEVRKEKAAEWWNRYGIAVVGAAVLLVLGVAGYKGWSYFEQQRRMDLSETFVSAMQLVETGRSDAALAAFAELSDRGDKGYPLLAAFHRASLLLESGDKQGALLIWDEISRDEAAGTGFQGAAVLLTVQNQIGAADPAELRARLEPLTSEGLPFRSAALELMAVLALEEGKTDEAVDLYREVADDLNAPSGLRARAAQVLAGLGE